MSSRDKPVLVMVPGLGATGAVYEPFLKFFGDEYEVVSADLPHDLPETLSWDFFLDSVDRVVRDRKVYMVGHSLGGATALKYAATYPDKVKKLAVVAPVAFPVRPHREYVGLSRFGWYRRLYAGLLAIWNGHLIHLLNVVRVRQTTLGGDRRQRLYAWANQIDLADDIPKLKDATVLWPKREELIDPKTFERFQTYQNIKTASVPGSHNTLALGPIKLISPIRKALHG